MHAPRAVSPTRTPRPTGCCVFRCGWEWSRSSSGSSTRSYAAFDATPRHRAIGALSFRCTAAWWPFCGERRVIRCDVGDMTGVADGKLRVALAVRPDCTCGDAKSPMPEGQIAERRHYVSLLGTGLDPDPVEHHAKRTLVVVHTQRFWGDHPVYREDNPCVVRVRVYYSGAYRSRIYHGSSNIGTRHQRHRVTIHSDLQTRKNIGRHCCDNTKLHAVVGTAFQPQVERRFGSGSPHA